MSQRVFHIKNCMVTLGYITNNQRYPLVNQQKTMERSTMLCSWVNPLFRLGHFLCRFFYVYQAGYLWLWESMRWIFQPWSWLPEGSCWDPTLLMHMRFKQWEIFNSYVYIYNYIYMYISFSLCLVLVDGFWIWHVGLDDQVCVPDCRCGPHLLGLAG